MCERYLLILIGCDGGELGLGEGKAVHPFSWQRLDLRQVHPRVVPDDVHTWLVLMHRLKNDLMIKTFAGYFKLCTVNLKHDIRNKYVGQQLMFIANLK